MPRTSKRLDRISDQLKQELAQLVQSELRDPRVGMVSVMDVRVSRDLAHADVFVTMMGAEPDQAVAIMNNAAGYLRSLLAKNLNLRVTPRLKFIYDESIERGRHLSALIDVAVAEDARHDRSTDADAAESSGDFANPSARPSATDQSDGNEADPSNTNAADEEAD